MIGRPPVELGADQVSATWFAPGTADNSVGGFGAVAGIAESAFEGTLVPFALVAVTVKE